MSTSPAAQILRIDKAFDLELGGRLDGIEMAYETHGSLDRDHANAILLCPAFSAHSHAASSPRDPEPGWWEAMVGPGRAFDTDRHFVVTCSLLGGCHGSAGPRSLDRSGRLYEGRFPLVTIGDIVRAQLLVLDHLGIDRLHAAAGGSMGAMETLELALSHPGRCARTIAVSGTDRTRPATAAIRHLGRRAIMMDPAFRDGNYGDEAPMEGLRLARELGTVFYRSKEEFDSRFRWEPIAPASLGQATFDVQSYLEHQGRKVVRSFDANAYLRLSMAMDLHDVTRGGRSFARLARQSGSRFLIGGVHEDRLMPIVEQRGVHRQLVDAGVTAEWFEVSSPVGHDAFLVDHETFTPIFRRFLES